MKLRSLPGLALAGLLGTGILTPSCEKKSHRETAETHILERLQERFAQMVQADLNDGHDDFQEEQELARRKKFLQDLEQRDPEAYKIFLLQLELLLQGKAASMNDVDVAKELNFLDFPKLFQRVRNRRSFVSPDGIVHFPSKEDERKFSLAELTPDDEIEFEALNPKTLEKMGITASAPFRCYRVFEKTQVRLGDRTIEVSSGTFVVKTKNGSLFKVLVFEGDRILDRVTRAITVQKKLSGEIPQAPREFEQFLTVKMPKFSLNRAREIFDESFPLYRNLINTEYQELLVSHGIPFEKHFVYYLEWCYENSLSPSEASMRMFLDLLSQRVKEKEETKSVGEKAKESKTPGKVRGILDKAVDALFGVRDEDEDRLSYHDERVKDASEKADIVRKKYGPLFAIVRLQGSFFDLYTYNRLSGNHSAAVSATAIGDKEYLALHDIQSRLESAPLDIQETAKASSFVERLNETSTFDSLDVSSLKSDLAFSHSQLFGEAVTPDDFVLTYGADGKIRAIHFRGEPYEAATFFTSPDRLRQIPKDTVSVEIGGVEMTFNLQDYFEYYHDLEDTKRGVSQNILVYNVNDQQITQMRNAPWFVEDGSQSIYRQVAKQITKNASTSEQKLLALGRWLQLHFDYQDEIGEVNKITLATFMDRGGDCEDSYTAFKTLANAIGLGDYVGAVLFENHIAPMIRGNLGPTTYQVNGEIFTIFELATPLGKTVASGITSHENPRIYVLPDGSFASASQEWVPLRIVPSSELDPELVDKFQKAVKSFSDFIDDPAHRASKENEAREEEILANGLGFLEEVKGAYGEIGKSGKMAEAISDQVIVAMRKAQEFGAAWKKTAQEKSDKVRRLELSQTPGKFRTDLEKYLALDRHLLENFSPTLLKMEEVTKKYIEKGREDSESTLALHNELIHIINESRVYMDIQEMQLIYQGTLRFLPTDLQRKVEQDLKGKITLVQRMLDLINVARSNLRK